MSGCEPGWACRTAKDVKVDLKDDKNVPVRTQQCAPCCAGFFCPRGITCMIRKLTSFKHSETMKDSVVDPFLMLFPHYDVKLVLWELIVQKLI